MMLFFFFSLPHLLIFLLTTRIIYSVNKIFQTNIIIFYIKGSTGKDTIYTSWQKLSLTVDSECIAIHNLLFMFKKKSCNVEIKLNSINKRFVSHSVYYGYIWSVDK